MNYQKLKQELGHKERTIADLISYIEIRTNDQVPNYSLLLGAGASYSSGITTGEGLVNRWREEIYKLLSNNDDYTPQLAQQYLISNESNWYSLTNEYSSLFEKKFDLPAQRRRFVEKEVDTKLPSIGYSYLVSLTKNRYFDTIYTTNFDDLLNEAFYQFSRTRPIVCAHDSSLNTISVTSMRPKIIKLHGDYLFDDIKSTLRETESLETNIKNKLIQFSKEYGLIVMGYSGNDRSIMDVINYLLKTEEYLKNGVYWCVREEDEINPELIKLLWKERVYFVKIDGFDEALAEIHHNLEGELSLEDNFTNTKKEAIISSFTKDEYELGLTSELINFDIKHLRKHKNSMDISNIIRELNEDDVNRNESGGFSEEEFKILLTIDRLLKDNNYSEAKRILNSRLELGENSKYRERYIRKLININKLQGLETEAISLCDELIKIDPWNVEYYLFKASNIQDLSKASLFIKEYHDKFLSHFSYHNYMINIGMREIEHTGSDPVFTIDSLLKNAETSLALEPSLQNKAWDYKVKLLKMQYDCSTDKKEKKDKSQKIKEHIDKLGAINKTHCKYLEMQLNNNYLENKYSKVSAVLNKFQEQYYESSKNKQLFIFELMCDQYASLEDFDGNENYKNDWLEFIESDLFKSQKEKGEKIALLICEAKFYLAIEKDNIKCLATIKKASNCYNSYTYIRSIIQLLGYISDDYEEMFNVLERASEDISDNVYHYLKSEIYIVQKKYEEAINQIEKSFQKGSSLFEYLSRKSFVLIKDKKYEAPVILIDNSLDKITPSSEKYLLMINRELAVHFQKKPINELQIRNIISRSSDESLMIASECLLGKEVPAKRLIKKAIEKDYSNLFVFKTWPVIPCGYLNEYAEDSNQKVAS